MLFLNETLIFEIKISVGFITHQASIFGQIVPIFAKFRRKITKYGFNFNKIGEIW